MFLQGQKVGKYEIIRSLGSGGFGSVFLAKDTWLDIKVAIKVPHKQSVELYKLLKEPRLQAALNHPNIVRMISAEKEKNVFFMVMEYVKGRTLEKILEKEKSPGLRTRPWISSSRSPTGSTMPTRTRSSTATSGPRTSWSPRTGTVKITDFGTSAWLNSVPYASTRIGSPPYMAPEQFMGKASYASDIYSIGCIFYEMIIGRPPIFDPGPLQDPGEGPAGEDHAAPDQEQQGSPGGRRDHHEVPGRQDRGPVPERRRRSSAGSPFTRGGRQKLRDRGHLHPGSRPGNRQKADLCWNCRRPLPLKSPELSPLRGIGLIPPREAD